MRTSDLHHERHELHRLVAALALVLCICVAGRAADASAATSPAVDLRLDFETGDGSQFSGFECPHPGTQFGVYDETSTSHPTPRQGRFAARFSETAADVWPGNDMVRCLGARYDSGESAGDDRYYALSVYIPATGLSDNLLWELHHPSSLYNLPGCGVAPLALVVRNGRLAFRIATGNCTVGSGYAYWQPGIELPGLQSLPRSTWVDVVMHVVFSEHDDGRVELWYRTGTGAFPALPQLARYGIPTMPRADSAGVHDVTLYTELGLYPGRTGYASSDSVYLDGYRRGSSLEAVLAEFPDAGAAATASDAPPSETPPPGLPIRSPRPLSRRRRSRAPRCRITRSLRRRGRGRANPRHTPISGSGAATAVAPGATSPAQRDRTSTSLAPSSAPRYGWSSRPRMQAARKVRRAPP